MSVSRTTGITITLLLDTLHFSRSAAAEEEEAICLIKKNMVGFTHHINKFYPCKIRVNPRLIFKVLV
jgi:hypothetical protein